MIICIFFLSIYFIDSIPTNEVEAVKFREGYLSIVLINVNPFLHHKTCEYYFAEITADFILTRRTQMACIDEKTLRVDLNFDDYYEVVKEDLFLNVIKFKVTIKEIIQTQSTTLFEHQTHDIRIRPNSYEDIEDRKGDLQLSLYVVFRCHGFTGYNCHLKNLDHPGFKLHPNSGKVSCPIRKNCHDLRCKDNSYCKNNGSCYETTFAPVIKYCVCHKINYGRNCEKWLEHHRHYDFTEDDILYTPIRDIPNGKRISSCNRCDLKPCHRYGTIDICVYGLRDPEILACKLPKCIRECGQDICYLETNDDIVYYFKNGYGIRR